MDKTDINARTCTEQGGKLIVAPKPIGCARFCIIEDPAGAPAALYQAG